MERILLALDDKPGSVKAVEYVISMLGEAKHVEIILFHVLPTISPNLLHKSEVRRIEVIHEQHPHLTGHFWHFEDEKNMESVFLEARRRLTEGGFPGESISERYGVESHEIAQVILDHARVLDCRTIVVGRRGLSRVKEFFLGSVSKSLVSMARGVTVWIVDT